MIYTMTPPAETVGGYGAIVNLTVGSISMNSNPNNPNKTPSVISVGDIKGSASLTAGDYVLGATVQCRDPDGSLMTALVHGATDASVSVTLADFEGPVGSPTTVVSGHVVPPIYSDGELVTVRIEGNRYGDKVGFALELDYEEPPTGDDGGDYDRRQQLNGKAWPLIVGSPLKVPVLIADESASDATFAGGNHEDTPYDVEAETEVFNLEWQDLATLFDQAAKVGNFKPGDWKPISVWKNGRPDTADHEAVCRRPADMVNLVEAYTKLCVMHDKLDVVFPNKKAAFQEIIDLGILMPQFTKNYLTGGNLQLIYGTLESYLRDTIYRQFNILAFKCLGNKFQLKKVRIHNGSKLQRSGYYDLNGVKVKGAVRIPLSSSGAALSKDYYLFIEQEYPAMENVRYTGLDVNNPARIKVVTEYPMDETYVKIHCTEGDIVCKISEATPGFETLPVSSAPGAESRKMKVWYCTAEPLFIQIKSEAVAGVKTVSVRCIIPTSGVIREVSKIVRAEWSSGYLAMFNDMTLPVEPRTWEVDNHVEPQNAAIQLLPTLGVLDHSSWKLTKADKIRKWVAPSFVNSSGGGGGNSWDWDGGGSTYGIVDLAPGTTVRFLYIEENNALRQIDERTYELLAGVPGVTSEPCTCIKINGPPGAYYVDAVSNTCSSNESLFSFLQTRFKLPQVEWAHSFAIPFNSYALLSVMDAKQYVSTVAWEALCTATLTPDGMRFVSMKESTGNIPTHIIYDLPLKTSSPGLDDIFTKVKLNWAEDYWNKDSKGVIKTNHEVLEKNVDKYGLRELERSTLTTYMSQAATRELVRSWLDILSVLTIDTILELTPAGIKYQVGDVLDEGRVVAAEWTPTSCTLTLTPVR